MAMVRYQMFIDERQKQMLDEMHKRLKMPVAELVRRAIDRFAAEQAAGVKYPCADEQEDPLLALAGVCEGGPSDLADNHERYLHGEEAL